MQFASGVLVCSVLIQTPVRAMSPAEIHAWLSEMVLHFLTVDETRLPIVPSLNEGLLP